MDVENKKELEKELQFLEDTEISVQLFGRWFICTVSPADGLIMHLPEPIKKFIPEPATKHEVNEFLQRIGAHLISIKKPPTDDTVPEGQHN